MCLEHTLCGIISGNWPFHQPMAAIGRGSDVKRIHCHTCSATYYPWRHQSHVGPLRGEVRPNIHTTEPEFGTHPVASVLITAVKRHGNTCFSQENCLCSVRQFFCPHYCYKSKVQIICKSNFAAQSPPLQIAQSRLEIFFRAQWGSL